LSTKRDLQNPTFWRKVHNLWTSEIHQALKPQVAGRLSLAIDQEITPIEIDTPPQRLRTDLHLTDVGPPRAPSTKVKPATNAVAYAEGVEPWSTESRHFIVLEDLGGGQVVAVLEVLSPTQKGYYARADKDAFMERRQRLLGGSICYIEVDAVPSGTRWLPRVIESLAGFHGVAWSSTTAEAGRLFQGWAWNEEGPLPKIPWDLGTHGSVVIDLDTTFREALSAAGFSLEA
jgi:hypothetical protein